MTSASDIHVCPGMRINNFANCRLVQYVGLNKCLQHDNVPTSFTLCLVMISKCWYDPTLTKIVHMVNITRAKH